MTRPRLKDIRHQPSVQWEATFDGSMVGRLRYPDAGWVVRVNGQYLRKDGTLKLYLLQADRFPSRSAAEETLVLHLLKKSS